MTDESRPPLTEEEAVAEARAKYLQDNPTHIGLVGDLEHPLHPEHFASDDRKKFLREHHAPSAEAERERLEQRKEERLEPPAAGYEGYPTQNPAGYEGYGD